MPRAAAVRMVVRRGWVPLVAAVLALLALGAWALSSPVGSAPDDDFHLASIWCGDGLAAGKCEAGDAPDQRRVAQDVINGSICYAFHPEISAACQGAGFGQGHSPILDIDRGNFAGQYPPLYYAFMGLFAGPQIVNSVLIMRAVASLLFVAMLTALLVLLPSRYRPMAIITPLVTLIPLGLSLVASTNPSGWALLSISALLPALIGYFETQGARKVALGGIALVAALLGAGSRADSAAYAIVTVVIVGILFVRRSRRFLLESTLLLAIVVISAAFYLTSHQADVVSTGFTPGAHGSKIGLLAANLVLLPSLWAGFFGAPPNGLGWLDTEMPALVWVLGLGVLFVAAMVGLAHAGRRKALAVAIGFAAFCTIPLYTLVQSNAIVGSYLQPRYLLPLAILTVGLALMPETGGAPIRSGAASLTRTQIIICAVALAAMNATALQITMRRYITGTDVHSISLTSHLEWWWTGAFPSPNVVWIGGSVAFAALLGLLIWNRPEHSAGARTRRRAPMPRLSETRHTEKVE